VFGEFLRLGDLRQRQPGRDRVAQVAGDQRGGQIGRGGLVRRLREVVVAEELDREVLAGRSAHPRSF
jgi:hypothetical protein